MQSKVNKQPLVNPLKDPHENGDPMIGKRTSALRTTATETASCGAISSCFPKVSPNHKESEEITSKGR